jgi:hypothetical protein
MLFPPTKRVTDKTLTGYLLGSLRQDQTERLDELSIVDGDFAARLDAVENDMVDAYVRGRLSGDTLQKFRARYLSSAKRREKVRFSQSLYHFEGKHFTQAAATGESVPAQESRSLFSPGSWRSFAFPAWIAAGALAMMLAIGLLFIDNLQLRNRMSQANADPARARPPGPARSGTRVRCRRGGGVSAGAEISGRAGASLAEQKPCNQIVVSSPWRCSIHSGAATEGCNPNAAPIAAARDNPRRPSS